MRPILLVSALLLACAAPHAAQAQLYYLSTPYTVSYAPSYTASYAPNYVAYAPVAAAPVTTTYFASPQTVCSYSAPTYEQSTYRPVADSLVPNVQQPPVTPYRYQPIPVTTQTSQQGGYTVFAHQEDIYLADKFGRLWKLDKFAKRWTDFVAPVN